MQFSALDLQLVVFGVESAVLRALGRHVERCQPDLFELFFDNLKPATFDSRSGGPVGLEALDERIELSAHAGVAGGFCMKRLRFDKGGIVARGGIGAGVEQQLRDFNCFR